MRKSVFGLAAVAALTMGTAAHALVEIPLNIPTVGLSGSATSDGSTAVLDGGVVKLFSNTPSATAGSGMTWARYNLSTPVPVGIIKGLDYTTKVISMPTTFIAAPVFLIDADNDGIEGDPALWHTNMVAANLQGDSIITSDVTWDAPPAGNGGADANFVFHTLIGPGEIVDGWYPSDSTGNGFGSGYEPTFPAFQALLPHEGIDSTDLVYAIYLFNGGSGNYSGEEIHISDVSLFVPEPASLGLLSLGGVLMLKRRRTA